MLFVAACAASRSDEPPLALDVTDTETARPQDVPRVDFSGDAPETADLLPADTALDVGIPLDVEGDLGADAMLGEFGYRRPGCPNDEPRPAYSDVVLAGCCPSGGGCEGSAYCSPEHWCVPIPEAGRCFIDDQCPTGQECAGAAAPECGAGELRIGTCVDAPEGCCAGQMAPSCAGDAWCLDGNFCGAFGALYDGSCLSDTDCPLSGWVCDGAVGVESPCCQKGPRPVLGQCVPSGPGGQCLVYTPGLLGPCEAVVGWMWAGLQCAEVSGCGCEPFCGDVFPSKEACLTACFPAQCCAFDEDCGQGLRCHLGHCVAPPAEGHCYTNGDCGDGLCLNESNCLCGSKYCNVVIPLDSFEPMGCDQPYCEPWSPPTTGAHPGTCYSVPKCCATDADCAGLVCLAGACQPAAPAGACWTAANCGAGQHCDHPKPCPCTGVACVAQPGSCAPWPTEHCCESDASCPVGQSCSSGSLEFGNSASYGADVGVCGPPDGDWCQRDDQCAPDEYCPGGTGLSCWASVAMELWGLGATGHCRAKLDAPCDHLPCATGYTCAGTDINGFAFCKPLPEVGTCWATAQCGAGMACVGMRLCGPNDGDCPGGEHTGTCELIATACCLDDGGCAPGEWCTAADHAQIATVPGIDVGQCIPAVEAPNRCFGDRHCAAGESCFTKGLPCGFPTAYATGQEMLDPGYCSPPTAFECQLDADCADGLRCYGPGVEPWIGGRCKALPAAATCWGDRDCPPGATCHGGYRCPSSSVCPVWLDSLGSCVD